MHCSNQLKGECEIKVNKILFLVSFCIIFSSVVNMTRAVAGQGRVSMQGAINNTACAIAVESRYQVIDMDIVPLADIRRNGKGKNKPFTIFLTNCMVEQSEKKGRKEFQVTFDGNSDGALFDMSGKASGVGLQITDEKGNIVSPGVPLPFSDITPGNMRLDYNIKLVANKKPLKSGDYFSSIRFRLDYF